MGFVQVTPKGKGKNKSPMRVEVVAQRAEVVSDPSSSSAGQKSTRGGSTRISGPSEVLESGKVVVEGGSVAPHPPPSVKTPLAKHDEVLANKFSPLGVALEEEGDPFLVVSENEPASLASLEVASALPQLK